MAAPAIELARTINPVSNQALMTTMKGLIDIVEDKQARWTPVLIEMFTEALKLAVYIAPEMKAAINEDDWFLKIEWPSVLRREDATYQQMWLNLFNAGVISLETYYEKLGFAERACFTDTHHIAHFAGVLFVMRMELGCLFYKLSIDRVLHLTFHSNSDGLFHFVAGHNADPGLS